jgi:hypothetical protein
METPSPEHQKFDELCSGVEEFETLPEVSTGPLEREPEDEDATPMDGQILAGLVTPV